MKKLACLIICTVLIALLGCVSEADRWNRAKKENNIVLYEGYLKSFPEGAYADSAKMILDKIYFARAESLQTVYGFEEYLKKGFDRKLSDSAKHMIEKISFTFACDNYSIVALENFIADRPESVFKDSARHKINELLKERKPEFRTIDSVKIEVIKSGDAKFVDFNLERFLADILENLGLTIIYTYNNPKSSICLLKISARGTAYSAGYWGQLGGSHYTSCDLSGSVSFNFENGKSYGKSYSGYIPPAGMISSSYLNPEDAPFSSAIWEKGSLIEKFLELITDNMGKLAIVPLLGCEDIQIRLAAVDRIGKTCGDKGVRPLILALKDSDNSVKEKASQYLGSLKNKDAVNDLIIMLNDITPSCRSAAAEALGKIGDKNSVQAIINLLKDKEPSVRNSAVLAISGFKDPRSIPDLISALADESSLVRKSAAFTLNKLGWNPQNIEQKVQYNIATNNWNELVSLGKPAVEKLCLFVVKTDYDIQDDIAETLGKIGDSAAVEALIKCAENITGFDLARQKSVWALGNINNSKNLPALKKLLKDNDWYVRTAAARSLNKLGWTPETNELKVLYLIAKANINDCVSLGTDAVQPLIEAMKFYDIHDQAVSALVKIRKPAIEPLIKGLSNNKYDYIKEGARTALEKITKQNFQENAYRWQQWWELNKSVFK